MAQGTLLWQPILGQIGENRLIPPSFIALAFQHGLEDRNADVKRFRDNDSSTSDRHLMSFHSVG